MRGLGFALFLLVSYSIVITVLYYQLRHRVRASKDPLLVLPKKDRIAHARLLLDRQQEEYEFARQQLLEDQIRKFTTHERKGS